MDTGTKLAVAAVFVWLGMVLAISFGGGIGRLMFRALNACEYVCAFVIALALFTHETSLVFNMVVSVAVGSLLTQTVAVRPLLSRGTDDVLAGEDGPRSAAHYVYLALELVKVIALIWAGVLLVGA